MRKVYYFGFFALIFACFTVHSPAATVYTVNADSATSPDFTDLSACLAQVNATTDTAYTVNFTDTAATVYTLSPQEISIRNGVQLTFSPSTPNVVSVSGRLDVANGGGTFTASDMNFQDSGQWVFIQGYDGQTYTNCIFGPGTDNGLLIRGGVNTLTNCTFTGVQNNAFYLSGGQTTATNPTWADCGTLVWTEGNNPGSTLAINGGSATATTTGGREDNGFRMGGAVNFTVSNFTSTGRQGSIQWDFQQGSSVHTFSDCQFLNGHDSPVMVFGNGTYNTTMTLNNCLIEEQAATGGNPVNLDMRGSNSQATVILNACVVRHLAPSASTLTAWKGGTIEANNCLLVGSNNGVLSSTENSGYNANVVLNHCDITSATTQAVGVGDYPGTAVTIRNTIIDSSNGSGINASGTNVVSTIEYNLVNAASSTPGSPYFTGDPMFADPSTYDFHILPGSAAIGRGVPTSLNVDFYGNPRPMPVGTNPDIGLAEEQTVAPPAAVRDWQLF